MNKKKKFKSSRDHRCGDHWLLWQPDSAVGILWQEVMLIRMFFIRERR